MLNKVAFEGKWRTRRGQIRQSGARRRIVPADPNQMAGKVDTFICMPQEKNSYAGDNAASDFDRQLMAHEANPKKTDIPKL